MEFSSQFYGYHVSPTEFRPGDQITSAASRGTESLHKRGNVTQSKYNYYVTDPDHVDRYISHIHSRGLDANVYRVLPTGKTEPDPIHKGQYTQGRRSKDPLQVTDLVTRHIAPWHESDRIEWDDE